MGVRALSRRNVASAKAVIEREAMETDDDIKITLSVGEVAKRAGVAVSTLHFYESKGLIEGWRTDGNQRRYHRSVLRRVAIIRVAQRAGIPLQVVREALRDFPHDRPPDVEDWKNFSTAWRDMLDERIAALTELREHLINCIGCGCLSLEECPLRNPGDELGHEGAGPRRLASIVGEARSQEGQPEPE
ncbi:transcriptional regulator, MerR family [Rhodomicrobium vannielii ATCC 17100]|uniref:Transcriptional regulator, MerR family n=2 Tax=Rhodomicrobium vannielii TaxID=1069 RepID=E3HYM9_RHOVT|nr:transcriptional regulator, MerR family [Rhodomicrobium vannielii ATCC 17100]